MHEQLFLPLLVVKGFPYSLIESLFGFGKAAAWNVSSHAVTGSFLHWLLRYEHDGLVGLEVHP